MLIQSHIKERLNLAYVHAVAGRAGVNVEHSIHDYGVDGSFRAVQVVEGRHIQTGFPVDFQLKATVNWRFDSDRVVYDLDARAHDMMVTRERSAVPLVLILMCLPEDERLWLRATERALLIKNSCYWHWLQAGPPSGNSSSVRVRIPRANLLTSESLLALLQTAREYAHGERIG